MSEPTPLDVGRIVEVLDRHGVEYLLVGGVAATAALAAVLGGRRDRENLDPDPFEIDPNDVRPRRHSHHSTGVFENHELPGLEDRSRRVVQPTHGVSSDPLLDLVLEPRPC